MHVNKLKRSSLANRAWNQNVTVQIGKSSKQQFNEAISASIYHSRILNRGGVEDTRLEAKVKAKDTKKNPRPRPAFPRTELLEVKDRNARGQGQGPRTQAQLFSKKKVFKKSFPGNLQFKGVARILDWGGLNHKSHAMTSSKNCLLFT